MEFICEKQVYTIVEGGREVFTIYAYSPLAVLRTTDLRDEVRIVNKRRYREWIIREGRIYAGRE